MDDFGAVLRGSWGVGCWCMFPRLTAAQVRELPGSGSMNERRRRAMTKLDGRRRAPRTELARVEASRATPRVDDMDVWVIPCVTVRKSARGRGGRTTTSPTSAPSRSCAAPASGWSESRRPSARAAGWRASPCA